MPRANNFMDMVRRRQQGRQQLLPDPEAYPVLIGRELYDYPSLTMLNRLAVDEHFAYATRGMVVSPDNDDARLLALDVVQRLLIDGSLVWYAGGQVAIAEFAESEPVAVGTVQAVPPELLEVPQTFTASGGAFLDRVVLCSSTRAVQKVAEDWRRVLAWTGSEWRVEEWQQQVGEGQWGLLEVQTVPADAVRLFPHGAGLLVPAQQTFHRLEELQQALRRQTTKGALARIFIGYFGLDDAEFEERVASYQDFQVMPPGTQVINTADSTVTTMLIEQYNSLFMRFFQGVHLVPSESLKDESGVARGWRFRPTVAYVEQVEDAADRILAEFGVSVDWQPMPVADATELNAHFDFFTKLYDAAVIDESEYVTQVRSLAGLGANSGFTRPRSAEPESDTRDADAGDASASGDADRAVV